MNQKTNKLAACLTAVLLAGTGFVGGRVSVPSDDLPGMAMHASARSGEWPRVRAEFLRTHPVCAVCGATKDLEVHHVIPFHKRPDLELAKENLIVVCRGKRNDHFYQAHSADWRAANPHIAEDAALMRKRIKERVY